MTNEQTEIVKDVIGSLSYLGTMLKGIDPKTEAVAYVQIFLMQQKLRYLLGERSMSAGMPMTSVELTAMGVPEDCHATVAGYEALGGINIAALIAWALKYGPQAWAMLQELLPLLQKYKDLAAGAIAELIAAFSSGSAP